jgi:hypothetical protein
MDLNSILLTIDQSTRLFEGCLQHITVVWRRGHARVEYFGSVATNDTIITVNTRKDDVEAEGLGGRSQAQFCPVNW